MSVIAGKARLGVREFDASITFRACLVTVGSKLYASKSVF